MKKEKRITIRLTEDEYEKIKRKAEKINVSVSEYVRNFLSKKEVKIVDKTSLRELIYQLQRIGVNINQMVKKVNLNHSDIELKKEIEELEEIYKKLKELL